MCYWHKRERLMNRSENLKITHLWLIDFWWRCQNNSMREVCLLNVLCWENRISTFKMLNLDLYLTPYTNINSKQITDLSRKRLRPDYKTFSRQHKRNYLYLWLSILKTSRVHKEKNSKLDILKIKRFVFQKSQLRKWKDKPPYTQREYICKTYIW